MQNSILNLIAEQLEIPENILTDGRFVTVDKFGRVVVHINKPYPDEDHHIWWSGDNMITIGSIPISRAAVDSWWSLVEQIHPTNTSSNRSDGSTADYYQLPDGATQLQDLISHRDMNAQIGEILRACYRYGMASHSDQLRDAKKIQFYINAEIERLEKIQWN